LLFIRLPAQCPDADVGSDMSGGRGQST
jgi:hypothetical protein